MNEDILSLQATLHELIPISRAMELVVEQMSPESLMLRAPLALNHNHAGTGFAGSIYSVASLAGWAMLRSLVDREGIAAELVLGEGRIRYNRPLDADLTATVRVSLSEQQRVLDTLREGNTAQLRLTVHLPDEIAPAATFHGAYFARPASS